VAMAEPADQVFYSFSKILISKERKLQKYNFISSFYKIQGHSRGLENIVLKSRTFHGYSGSTFFLKDIPGIPGAVRTLPVYNLASIHVGAS
jgi:hypothetical protein